MMMQLALLVTVFSKDVGIPYECMTGSARIASMTLYNKHEIPASTGLISSLRSIVS